MSGDTTTNWGIPEYTFSAGEDQWSKFSRIFYKFSDANRQRKHKEKLRESLVRDHINGQAQQPSLLGKVIRKIFRKN